MTVQASQIIARARTQLIDTGAVERWTDEEMLKWLSDGQRAAVAIAPATSATITVSPLVAGTKQSIPTDGYMLLTITRNMGVSRTTPGRACRIVSREVMDAFDPDWHTNVPAVSIKNYLFEPTLPRVFYVYPPSDGTGSVEISYSVMPVELTSVTDTIGLTDVYQTALLDYLLYRCYQKDSDFSAGQGLAALYLQSFITFVSSGENSQVASNPNIQLAPSELGSKAGAK